MLSLSWSADALGEQGPEIDSLLDTVETLDIGVSLLLELWPIERLDHLVGSGVVTETVGNGLSNIVGRISAVPHDLCFSQLL